LPWSPSWPESFCSSWASQASRRGPIHPADVVIGFTTASPSSSPQHRSRTSSPSHARCPQRIPSPHQTGRSPLAASIHRPRTWPWHACHSFFCYRASHARSRSIVAVLVCTAVSAFFPSACRDHRSRFGGIPRGLPPFAIPDFHASTFCHSSRSLHCGYAGGA